jgi:hypothetical protein
LVPKFRKSTAGKSASKGAGPKAVPIKALGTKRRYTCSCCAAASVKNLRDPHSSADVLEKKMRKKEKRRRTK